jgi:hypothetical protein
LIFRVIGSEKLYQRGPFFFVKGLKFGFETFGNELLMDVIIFFDPFQGGQVFHWDNFDIITVKT